MFNKIYFIPFLKIEQQKYDEHKKGGNKRINIHGNIEVNRKYALTIDHCSL